MKTSVILTSLLATAGISQAALYINAGSTSPTAGIGPNGADVNYQAYGTPHESATSGATQTYNGTSFAGLGGTYDVGVSFSWLDATTDATKQSFSRTDTAGYGEFWNTWVGTDIRTTSGGINGGDRLQLSLTGLAANTTYVFTSYHFDTHDQSGTFIVDQTPTASETATSPFAFDEAGGVGGFTPETTNAYSFDVTSDGSGNLDITYTQNSGTWIGINGFDLVSTASVPEPSSTALLGLGGIALILRRRR
ncbi:PEP-CTERM sorting domain-containing protein [Rubritalea sp.]|uniref:PEP-CTERM sorting domain-containing protein n=1 Tax=Rubritalea sp. TaxID=2109375 RepID=UPI003EF78B8E